MINSSPASLYVFAFFATGLSGQQSRPSSEPTRLERLRDYLYHGSEPARWADERARVFIFELIRNGDFEAALAAVADCLEDEQADGSTRHRRRLILTWLIHSPEYATLENEPLNRRLASVLRHEFTDRGKSCSVRGSAIALLQAVRHAEARLLENEVIAELERTASAIARGKASEEELQLANDMSTYLRWLPDIRPRSVSVLVVLGASREMNRINKGLPMRYGFESLSLLPQKEQVPALRQYVEAYRDPEIARDFDRYLQLAARYFLSSGISTESEQRVFTALALDRVQYWATTREKIPGGIQDQLARYVEEMCDVIAGDKALLEQYRLSVQPHAATFWAAPFRAPSRTPK